MTLIAPKARDPLLAITRGVCFLALSLMVVGGVACAIALPGLLVFKSTVAAEIGSAHPNFVVAGGYGSMIGLVVLALLLTVGVALFLRQLLALLATVTDDPFVPENAARLGRMAWLMLGLQAIGLGLSIVATQFGEAIGKPAHESRFDLNSILLVLLLFILARVFRHGTALRAEVEGTV